ncbi:hypothetical protein [Cesiribacter andamanensis]|uniref:Uncharacterized protein n=1 Tax=Cesiribacter andamanensis AMV16 TaxID=1279009 RepID=M7NA77_9BACT|nr:hypothetical protein [Cesiribacter andamanensis]EMR04106.1 hypothetical protein ADICEAN_00729 [Cesiribacter andamanensis AMV16]
MNERIRKKLIQIARLDESPISYPNLVYQMSLGLNLESNHEKNMLGEILNEISTEEFKQGRPLLSSLVKIKPKGQGDTFFKMCEKVGLGQWKELKRDPDFLEKCRQECRDFWMNEENYEKHLYPQKEAVT